MGHGLWVTDPGFVCVMGFGCYNGGAVTCHGGAVTCCHDPNPLNMNLDT